MRRLESVGGLAVSQVKEWGEILTGFEGVNKYVVSDERGTELFYALEERGSLLARLFLKAYRPFAIDVLSRDGEILLRIERSFRFYFHTAEIFDGSGTLIGTLERHFSVLRRVYSVLSAGGDKLFDLFGPLFRP